MQTSNCTACGKPYLILVGHSCGDTVDTQLVREVLAKEIEKRQVIEKELEELRRIALPMNFHFNGNYNKWAVSNSGHLKLMDAAELLRAYFKER